MFLVAQEVKQSHTMQVIQGSDFFTKFSSKKIDLFSEENFEINKCKQIEILISAIENEEERDNFFLFL